MNRLTELPLWACMMNEGASECGEYNELIDYADEQLKEFYALNLTPSEISTALSELATLKKHHEELKSVLKGTTKRLKRKCEDEARAVKCICDVETYLDLGSVRYALGVIGKWRTPEEAEVANEAQGK